MFQASIIAALICSEDECLLRQRYLPEVVEHRCCSASWSKHMSDTDSSSWAISPQEHGGRSSTERHHACC